MGNDVQELIDMLYDMVNEAWDLPLGGGKCVVEKDKVLDILDELKVSLPKELSDAKQLMNAKTEYIAAARKEVDRMRAQAQEEAEKLINQEEVLKQAQARSAELIALTDAKCSELRRAANEYAANTLAATEETVSSALAEIKAAKAKFATVR